MPRRKRNLQKQTNNTKSKNTKEEAAPEINWGSIDIDNLIQDTLIEGILSNRSATRENSLRNLIKALSLKYCYDVTSSNIASICEAISKSLKKSKTSIEFSLDCQALGLLGITLGANSEELLKEFSASLKTHIKDPSENSASKCEAVRCLSLLYFLTSNDDYDMLEYCEFIEQLLFPEEKNEEEMGEEFRVGLLSSWLLCLTIVPFSYLKRNSMHKLRFLLKEPQADTSSVPFKLLLAQLFGFIMESLAAHSPELVLTESPLPLLNPFVDTSALISSLKECLANNNNHNHNNHNNNSSSTSSSSSAIPKKVQRQIFTNVLQTLEQGTSPSIDLEIKKHKIKFDTWTMLLQLEFLKSILLEGFQRHFEENSVLAEIFDFDLSVAVPDLKMSKLTKKIYQGPSSASTKERTRARAKDRAIHGRTASSLLHDNL